MTNYNETSFHTSFILICKEAFGSETIKELLNSSKLSSSIEGTIETNFDKLIFLTIYPNETNKNIKKFETAKIDLINLLSNVCDYISIFYDAQTATYMKEISHSVYQLEREFRGLIEIIFLKQYGVKWYNKFFEDNTREKDRTEGRPDFIQHLNNPLDNRDFVDLRKFVEKTINTSKNAVIHKLEEVNFKLDTIQQENPSEFEQETMLNESLKLLKEIKEITDTRNESLQINNLYEHLTPALSKEWHTLYKKRNLWAHNYCLFTQKELNEYKLLANTVLDKIRTEITLLSLLNNNDNPFIINSSIVNITLQKAKENGNSVCRLKIKFNLHHQNHQILEIHKATYKDLICIFKYILELSGSDNYRRALNNFESNPFLTNTLKNLFKEILDCPDIQNVLQTKFDDFTKKLTKKYLVSNKATLHEIDSIESQMDDDLNTYLQTIFQ
ncbi:hypothetical protein [Bacillus sp. II_CA]|uniref:hypothetical protein n=1 Tax=Bacillus sp. II_CA TaxID=3417451 RepID=UPI003CF7F8C9